MTSARKIRANRANARASSGPKTAAGKAQSAQNAFRHGFNVPVWRDPDLASGVEALAQRIVGEGADANVLESARRIAAAQIDLRRVRSYRHQLIERAMADPKAQAETAEPPPFASAAARVGADDRGRILRADPLEAQVSVLVVEFTKNLAESCAPRACRTVWQSSPGNSRRSIATSAAPCRGANSPSASSTLRASKPNGAPATRPHPTDNLELYKINCILSIDCTVSGVVADFGGTKPSQKNAINQQSSGLCRRQQVRVS